MACDEIFLVLARSQRGTPPPLWALLFSRLLFHQTPKLWPHTSTECLSVVCFPNSLRHCQHNQIDNQG